MKYITLQDTPLDPNQLLSYVYSDNAGGVVSFIGTVRNETNGRQVNHLIFETYQSMALKEMEKIADHCLRTWPLVNILISHRVGRLDICDIPVVIIAVAPHRVAAFEACQYSIDQLKKTVPIWKKELYVDGEIWVSAHP